MRKKFTHQGRLRGDARAGGRMPTVMLRQTPSGNHWVDNLGRKFSTRNGWAPGKWPMWSLELATIKELLDCAHPGCDQKAKPNANFCPKHEFI